MTISGENKSDVRFYAGKLNSPIKEYTKVPTVSINPTRKDSEVEFVVLHHTATKCMNAEQMKLSMQRTWVDNR